MDSAPITWIDVLNEQAQWKNLDGLLAWLRLTVGKDIQPSKATLKEFERWTDFMRAQTGRLHFREPIDLQSVNRMLADVQLMIEPSQPTKHPNRIPVLRAKVSSSDDDGLVRMLQLTVFSQFAQFVADALEKGSDNVILRCQGLFRKGAQHEGMYRQTNADEEQMIEHRFREEIPTLVESGLLSDPDIQRCEDVFITRAKARFCCDACRFTTFQINKQLNDPKYLADKQRRYRQRLGQ